MWQSRFVRDLDRPHVGSRAQLVRLLGELLVTALLHSAGADSVAKFLPQQATLGALVNVSTATESAFLPWWGGLLTLAAWAAALCTGGWALNRVRDVG